MRKRTVAALLVAAMLIQTVSATATESSNKSSIPIEDTVEFSQSTESTESSLDQVEHNEVDLELGQTTEESTEQETEQGAGQGTEQSTEQSTEMGYNHDYDGLQELINGREQATEESTEPSVQPEQSSKITIPDGAIPVDAADPWATLGNGDRIIRIINDDGSVSYYVVHTVEDEATTAIEELLSVSDFLTKYEDYTIVVVKCDDETVVEKVSSAKAFTTAGDIFILAYEKESTANKEVKKLNRKDEVEFAEVSTELEVSSATTKSTKTKTTTKATRYSKEYTTSVEVAVLDTGIAFRSEVLADRVKDSGMNFSDTESSSILDGNGHGTTVAELIASNTTDAVKIFPIKIANDEGRATTLAAYLGIEAAIIEGVDVINLSMNTAKTEKSAILESAIHDAYNAGIQVVVSAGNLASNVKDIVPANLDEAIVVSAVDGEKKLEEYSNYGDTIDCTAYGYCSEGNGTSFAAARISAFVANAIGSRLEPLDTIQQYAEDLGDSSKYGYGFIDLGDVIPEMIDSSVSIFDVDWKSLTTEQLTELIKQTDTRLLGKFLYELSDVDKALIKERCPYLLVVCEVQTSDYSLNGTRFDNAIFEYTWAMSNDELVTSVTVDGDATKFNNTSGYFYLGVVLKDNTDLDNDPLQATKMEVYKIKVTVNNTGLSPENPHNSGVAYNSNFTFFQKVKYSVTKVKKAEYAGTKLTGDTPTVTLINCDLKKTNDDKSIVGKYKTFDDLKGQGILVRTGDGNDYTSGIKQSAIEADGKILVEGSDDDAVVWDGVGNWYDASSKKDGDYMHYYNWDTANGDDSNYNGGQVYKFYKKHYFLKNVHVTAGRADKDAASFVFPACSFMARNLSAKGQGVGYSSTSYDMTQNYQRALFGFEMTEVKDNNNKTYEFYGNIMKASNEIGAFSVIGNDSLEHDLKRYGNSYLTMFGFVNYKFTKDMAGSVPTELTSSFINGDKYYQHRGTFEIISAQEFFNRRSEARNGSTNGCTSTFDENEWAEKDSVKNNFAWQVSWNTNSTRRLFANVNIGQNAGLRSDAHGMFLITLENGNNNGGVAYNPDGGTYSSGDEYEVNSNRVYKDGTKVMSYLGWQETDKTKDLEVKDPENSIDTTFKLNQFDLKSFTTPSKPKKDGYVFKGWGYTDVEGKEQTLKAGKEYSYSNDTKKQYNNLHKALLASNGNGLVLKAVWKEAGAEVYYDPGKGQGVKTTRPDTIIKKSNTWVRKDDTTKANIKTYNTELVFSGNTFIFNYCTGDSSVSVDKSTGQAAFNNWEESGSTNSKAPATVNNSAAYNSLKPNDGDKINLTAQWDAVQLTTASPTLNGYKLYKWVAFDDSKAGKDNANEIAKTNKYATKAAADATITNAKKKSGWVATYSPNKTVTFKANSSAATYYLAAIWILDSAVTIQYQGGTTTNTAKGTAVPLVPGKTMNNCKVKTHYDHGHIWNRDNKAHSDYSKVSQFVNPSVTVTYNNSTTVPYTVPGADTQTQAFWKWKVKSDKAGATTKSELLVEGNNNPIPEGASNRTQFYYDDFLNTTNPAAANGAIVTFTAQWAKARFTLPTVQAPDGFYFAGWSTSKEHGEVVSYNADASNASLHAAADCAATHLAGGTEVAHNVNTTYYAHFTRRAYRLTFNYGENGGYKQGSQSITSETNDVPYEFGVSDRKRGSTATTLPTAEKSGDTGVYSTSNPDGWQFVGWALNPNETDTSKISKSASTVLGFIDGNKMPANNITLYAIYKKTVAVATVSHRSTSTNPYTTVPDSIVTGNSDGRIQTYVSADVWNKNTSATLSMPTAGTINGWSFTGWVRDYNAEFKDGVINDAAGWLANFKDKASNYTKDGYPSAASSVTVSHDTVYYAQYVRQISWYFVQNKTDDVGTGTIHRNSKAINQFVRTVTAKAPIIKSYYDWEPTKWIMSTTANDESKGSCEQNAAIQASENDVYFANYRRDITLSFNPTGHTAYKGADQLYTRTAQAYLSSSAYDRNSDAAIPLHVYTKNAIAELQSRVYGSVINSNVGEARSVIYPSFTMPAYAVWYRNAIKRETDVWQYCWTTEQTEDGKPDTHSATTGKALTDSHAAGTTITSYPEEFVKPIDFYEGATYEFRENTVMYTVLYSKSAKDDGDDGEESDIELIRKSVSILVGETVNVHNEFLTNDYSDTGRVFKVENLDVAKVDQSGKIQGSQAGQTVVRVYTSDGHTLIGKCTVTVSAASVTVPSEMTIGSVATIGVKVASNGPKVDAKLTLEALSALKGVYTGKMYDLQVSKSTDGKQYKAIKQGDAIVSATATNSTNETKVKFRVDTSMALETLQTDYYYSTLVWRLSVDKIE